MTTDKFPIQPFDPKKSKRKVRRIEPPVFNPKTAEDWNRLANVRSYTKDMRDDLDLLAAQSSWLFDPVISRAVLAIHYALARIERRTFRPKLGAEFNTPDPKDTPS